MPWRGFSACCCDFCEHFQSWEIVFTGQFFMNYIVVLEHMFELIVNKQKEREKNVCLSVKLSVDQKWRRRKLRNIGTKNRCKDIKTNGCKAFFDGSPVFLGLKLIENVFLSIKHECYRSTSQISTAEWFLWYRDITALCRLWFLFSFRLVQKRRYKFHIIEAILIADSLSGLPKHL